MSNIPEARQILEDVLINGGTNTRAYRYAIRIALARMVREKPIKRSRRTFTDIPPKMRREIWRLARAGISNHDIATRVGLKNGGRVSEVLTGKR